MKKNWLLVGTLGLVAAIVYFASLADYAFPGTSAQLMVAWQGLDAGSPVRYPLMAFFARMLGGGNLIAPVCGVLSVMTLFYLVMSFVAFRVTSEKLVGEREGIARVAGLVAAVVFLFSPAVRSAATHLEPKMFDFTWALLVFALAVPFFRLSAAMSVLAAVLQGVMVGLGLCDSALFLAFLPFFFVETAMLSVNCGKKPYLSLFLFLVAVVVTYFVALGGFGFGVGDAFKALSAELKDYRAQRGWIFVLFFATLPFVTALFSSGKAFGEASGLVTWLFHGAMSFVAVLAVATPLSPSSLMEPYGVCPVATSAFAAAVSGYLVAYWWANRRQVVGLAVGGVLLFVLTVSVCWNLFSFDGSAGAFADKVSRRILADLGTRRWLITDGTLDDHILLVAAKEGKDVNLVSLARDLDTDYHARLSELVKREGLGGSRNETLRLSLSLGVLPFVQDWFSSDPTVVKDVAIFGAPDLWFSAGLTPVPEFLFFGADESRTADWSAWKEFDQILKAPKGWGSYHDRKVSNPVDRMRFSLRRHMGFVANNRGVYLQDKKRDDEAFAMYELVLNEIDHDNICAIFNEVAMIGQKHPQAMSKKRELERMLKTAVEDKNRRYLLWRLGTYYGYIRNPDTFIRLGHAWARSGRPGDALSQIRRAIDFVPTDKRSVLLNMMASLYASENDQVKSRSLYESVLAKNANDHDALIGMMRLELLNGDTKKAMEYLERATKLKDGGNRGQIELAMLAMMKGNLAESKSILTKLTESDPKNMQAWSLRAAVTIQQIDAAKGTKEQSSLVKELEESVIPTMEKRAQNQFDYYLQATKGFVLLRKGEASRREARDAFVTASRARPDISTTHDMVLGLDISLDDKVQAETHAKEVLRRNRKAPLANYVMGSLALGKGKYAEAEMYLRRAAEASQPVVLALNDLAEVLRRNKNFTEAESYARKATERAPNLYVAWETLGSVLMDANRNLDEAEACIRKACQLSKDKSGKEADIRMLVSLARVQVKRNDMQHAKVTVRKVKARIDELSEFEKSEFLEVEKSVR